MLCIVIEMEGFLAKLVPRISLEHLIIELELSKLKLGLVCIFQHYVASGSLYLEQICSKLRCLIPLEIPEIVY